MYAAPEKTNNNKTCQSTKPLPQKKVQHCWRTDAVTLTSEHFAMTAVSDAHFFKIVILSWINTHSQWERGDAMSIQISL